VASCLNYSPTIAFIADRDPGYRRAEMNTTLTLIDLAGAVALLIWGVHMVQTGVTRAFGPQLRRSLGYAFANRMKAFLAGLGVTAILQSSTATGLMVTTFAAGGLVDLVPALAVMLGANVGTTLIVQALSFDVSRVSFLFILIGVMMFRRSGVTRTRDLGRVGIGLGLMLIALHHLLAMITPYEDAPSLRVLLGAITTDPLIDILLAAGLTWAAHSSVAVVLLIVAFAAQGIIPPHAAFALVLGANLGTAINPLIESGVSGDPAAKRLPIGNLINRVVGCAMGLAVLNWVGPKLVAIEPDAGRAVADFHTAFNIVLALLFFPVLRPFAKLLMKLLPARVDPADPSRPMYLDGAARDALDCACRGRPRGAAHGRCIRDDARRRPRFAGPGRSQAGRGNQAYGRRSRPARPGDQGIHYLARHRCALRCGAPAPFGDRGVHDQH
jgi:phosphate:Na+ symporter